MVFFETVSGGVLLIILTKLVIFTVVLVRVNFEEKAVLEANQFIVLVELGSAFRSHQSINESLIKSVANSLNSFIIHRDDIRVVEMAEILAAEKVAPFLGLGELNTVSLG